jgi:hypothetical protein
MASPHVAGAAAVMFGAGMNIRQVVDALTKTAGPARDSTVEGAGIIHMDRALGLESPVTTIAGARTGPGQGNVTRGGRAGAAGGSQAIAPTTTELPQGRVTVPGAAFEEGIETDDSKNLDAIRLQEASKNAANKPFNAAGPLVFLSGLCAVAVIVIAIPRLRAKDAPPLN